MAGIFTGPSYTSARAVLPSPFQISVSAGSSLLFVGTALDFERGVVSSLFGRDGASVSITSYAHQDASRMHLCVVDVFVDNSGSVTAMTLDLEDAFNASDTPDILFEAVTPLPNSSCVFGRISFTETNTAARPGVGLCRTPVPRTLSVAAGATARWAFVSSVWTTLDVSNSNPALAAAEELRALSRSSPSDLLRWHEEAMLERWAGSIEVVGNDKMARLVNASVWAILQSSRANRTDSVSPGGLGSNGYRGHVFWDFETYQFPTLALFDPNAARGALQYRADRLQAAQQNARLWGNAGAQFPWESAFTGTEVAQNGGNAQHEIHISGDIAFACWQYYVLSGDAPWL